MYGSHEYYNDMQVLWPIFGCDSNPRSQHYFLITRAKMLTAQCECYIFYKVVAPVGCNADKGSKYTPGEERVLLLV
jgi:hypothetical protein